MTTRGVRLTVASAFAILCLAPAPAPGHAPAPISNKIAPVGTALACPPCDDHNFCTVDSCDETTGTCRFDPLSCDDGNPCTTDFCQTIPSNPGCAHVPVADATPCVDGSTCTFDEACSEGVCVPGRNLEPGASCDDGNPCTVSDACDASHRCSGTPVVGGACDDGNACTREDRCIAGPGGTALCEGTSQDCSDGNLCTQDRCDPATGICLHPPVDCTDGNACTTDACDPATGLCRRDNVAGSCFDGLYCTTGETCVGGNCVGAQPIVCPQVQCGTNFCLEEDRVCLWRPSGGNSCPPAGDCIFYTCENGACRFNNRPTGTACTLPGYCGIAQCVHGGCQPAHDFDCDDHNSCSEDACPQGGCTHAPKADGTPCATDPCTEGSTCQSGVCTGGTPLACDDSNPCTVDSCDPTTGCRHVPVDCNDGNACTGDVCSTTTGQCVHNPVTCQPFGTCDVAACDPADGICKHHDGTCPAGTECEGSVCLNGQCIHGNVPNGTHCDLMDPTHCSIGECQSGRCEPFQTFPCNDNNPCTDDICGPPNGCNAVPKADGTACVANPCATGTCQAGVCSSLTPVGCDDGNPCTVDSCDPATGCVHAPLACDDHNACTTDSCDPNRGCVHDGPAQPAPETCNGKDDDCDGLVDERDTMPMCAVRPAIMKDSGTLQAFSVACRWTPACSPPGPPEPIGTVWLSAADLFYDPRDNEELPDPFASCATSIVENPNRRMITDTGVTFVFDPTGNGVCGTSGGGRPGLLKALADVPDKKLARVCIKWRQVGLGDTERCGIVLVRHDGSTEPQPLQGAPEDEDAGLLRPAP